jgi:hypothetical protein
MTEQTYDVDTGEILAFVRELAQYDPQAAARFQSDEGIDELIALEGKFHTRQAMLDEARARANSAPPVVLTAARAISAQAPALADISLLQVTIWDNWLSPTRPDRTGLGRSASRIPYQRYGVDLELWTLPGDEITNIHDLGSKKAFRGSTAVFPHDVFPKGLAKLVSSGAIDPEYAEKVSTLRDADHPTVGYGLIRESKAKRIGSTRQFIGRPYVPDTFIRLEVIGARPGLSLLYLGGEEVPLDGWSNRTAAGKPLTDNGEVAAIWQCRMNFDGLFRYGEWDSRSTV